MKFSHPFAASMALVFLGLPHHASIDDEPPVDPFVLEISGILLGTPASSPEETEALELAIAAYGSAAVPPCFRILSSAVLVRVVGEGDVEEVPLTQVQDKIVVAALRRLPARVVSDFLHWLGPDLETEAERATAVRLLKHVGRKNDIRLLVHLVNPPPETRRLDLAHSTAFSSALESMLKRDPLAELELSMSYDDAHPALVAPIVRAVGRMESVGGMRLLVRLFGRLEEADPLILIEIARMGEALPHPLGADILSATRRHLFGSDPERLMLAADACARLEDIEAAPLLIDLLKHPVRAVGNESREALEVMTGLNYGKSAARWAEWYEKNAEWWRYEAPELLAAVGDGEPAEASHAMLELSKWRFYRHEIADDVAQALFREERELVILACAVLGHLGSWEGVEPLIERLRAGDPEVLEAAARALKRITGRSFPDPEAWHQFVREST